MREIAAAVALISALVGCGGGEVSRVVEVPPGLRQVTRVIPAVPDRYPYGDPSRLKVGQWARYAEGDRTFTLAAVAKEGDDVWVEVVEEGEPREVSARLVAPGGAVKKALFREIAKDGPSDIVPQPLEQAARPPLRPAVEGSREGERVTVKVEGRELACRQRITWWTGEADGRRQMESSLWHPDVPPIYEGSDLGGLVRRKSLDRAIELLAFGTDARPLAVIK